ncbi:hypothetical protein ACFQ49_02860 [Kroppenstedtia eburnea]|uniref:hypothetical protein n=1 Tax=Kroppenstedtia eburnea TaxID=714067 RepID=UPI00362D3D8C
MKSRFHREIRDGFRPFFKEKKSLTPGKVRLQWSTHGYQVILAADAHSTTDNGVLTAEQIVAHHNRTLNGLENPDHYIQVLPSEEIRFGSRRI